MPKSTDFSAADSLLGYLYQIRLALLSSLQQLSKNEKFAVCLESLDDIVFEQSGLPPDLLQLKHHSRSANLTDSSKDLWKSFRVWMDGRAKGDIPLDSQLYLITTNSVGIDSSASFLTLETRDETKALNQLSLTARTSTSDENKTAYGLFLRLSPSEQKELVSSITIIPDSLSIIDVEEALRVQARFIVRRDYLSSFLSRLEGWWFRRVLGQLTAPKITPILSNEIESLVDDLREQFKTDSLPVDQDILDEEVNSDSYLDRIFVQQVKLAGIGKGRILAAIRDYYRAFTQRSRWIREDLILVGELDSYEKFLREEWELQFERFADEVGNEVAEDAKREAAQKIYAWAEASCFPIRPKVKHPSMTSTAWLK